LKIVAWIVTLALIGGLLLTLFTIVRWSIVSPMRRRGSRARLRRPDANGVAQLCGISVPHDLVEFYRTDPRVTAELLTLRAPDGHEWDFAAFNPLCVPDVSEWRKITRVPGFPIATDILKGVYYVSAEGAVMLASPEGTAIVAPNVRTFRTYVVIEPN
jgi:hypothetical protein